MKFSIWIWQRQGVCLRTCFCGLAADREIVGFIAPSPLQQYLHSLLHIVPLFFFFLFPSKYVRQTQRLKFINHAKWANLKEQSKHARQEQ